MADAPERIWAYETPDGDTGWLCDPTHGQATGSTEYVRADRIEALEHQLVEARAAHQKTSHKAVKRLRALWREKEAAEGERDRLAADNARKAKVLDRVRRTLVYPVSTAISARGWSPHNIDDDRMTFMIEEIDAALAGKE